MSKVDQLRQSVERELGPSGSLDDGKLKRVLDEVTARGITVGDINAARRLLQQSKASVAEATRGIAAADAKVGVAMDTGDAQGLASARAEHIEQDKRRQNQEVRVETYKRLSDELLKRANGAVRFKVNSLDLMNQL